MAETQCKICKCFCKHGICNTCVDEAMTDDKTRLEYINSSREFAKDWLEYTLHYFEKMDLPDYDDFEKMESMSGVNKRIFESIDKEDRYGMVASFAWINEDRNHFIKWLTRRNKL